MEISEVLARADWLLEVLDVAVYIFLAALLGLAIYRGVWWIIRLPGMNRAGLVWAFLALFGICIAYISPLVVLWTSATMRWRPVSKASYTARLKESEDRIANDFFKRYVSKDGTVPKDSVIGQDVSVQVQVTRIDFLVSFRKEQSEASPHTIRVEAKDEKGRLWVFFTPYEALKRNPVVSDKLIIGLTLKKEAFHNGYVSIRDLKWGS